MSDVNLKLLEACKRAIRYSENVANAEGVYFDDNSDLPFIRQVVEEAEKEWQSIPVAWHCANDIIGKHFFTTEWSQVEQLTESKNAAKWKITPLVPL